MALMMVAGSHFKVELYIIKSGLNDGGYAVLSRRTGGNLFWALGADIDRVHLARPIASFRVVVEDETLLAALGSCDVIDAVVIPVAAVLGCVQAIGTTSTERIP